jgi:glycosyltransferase
LPEALEKSPKVSIITVSSNGNETIAKTLESVIIQRYKEIECIVIDHGSGEEVKGIIEQGYGKFVDRFVREPGISPSKAMNLGVRAATGDILFFLDAACYLTDEKVVADVARLFVASPDVGAVFGNGLLDTGQGVVHLRQLHEADPSHLARKSIPLQTLFVRRGVFQHTGEFSETYHDPKGYDWVLNLFLKCRTRYRYIDREISMRIEKAQTLRQDDSDERLRILKNHYSRVEIFRYRTVPKGVSMIKDMVKSIRGRLERSSFTHEA